MKKMLFCLMIYFCTTGIFAQDFSVFNNEKSCLNDVLPVLNSGIAAFNNLFTGNALKILLVDVCILESKYRELDIFSLAQFDNRNLRLLRNMIYARHGYRFNTADLASFFGRFHWYVSKYDNVDSFLTNADKFHVQMIAAFENRNESLANVVLNNVIGFWHDSPAVASGFGERFIFFPNNRLEFYFSSMQNLHVVKCLIGSYSIKGNVLVFSVSELVFIKNNSDIVLYPGGYEWGESAENRMTFGVPLVFRFPVSKITTREWNSGLIREVLTIGGQEFFKFSSDVNFR
jgi:hypothetical protein